MSDTRLYAVWSDPRSRSRTLQSWKLDHLQKLSPLPFTKGAGNWQLFLKLGLSIWICSRQIFNICSGFCVTRLWNWQKRQLWRVDRQSCTGLIYFLFLFSCKAHYVFAGGFLYASEVVVSNRLICSWKETATHTANAIQVALVLLLVCWDPFGRKAFIQKQCVTAICFLLLCLFIIEIIVPHQCQTVSHIMSSEKHH